MLDARAAARLLASTRSAVDLFPVARAAGCDGTPMLLDDAGLHRIGLGELGARAHVCAGAGSLRALFIDLGDDADAAGAARTIAARLARRTPATLWLLIARARDVTIAAWSGERGRPRVAALRVDVPRVRQSDAESVAELAASSGGSDVLVHARWLEILGRDAITARFYRALDAIVRRMANDAAAHATPDERRTLALLHVTRLLFLSYLEAKGWLDGDPRFLARVFDRGAGAKGFQRSVLHPLFFGTLNTPVRRRAAAARALGRIPFLNGGLFARTPLERRVPVTFPDDAFGALFDTLLLRYRFTPREEQTGWAESAVDPEMLGRAFESLMHSGRRRDTGAFYTPLRLVSPLVDRGLLVALRDSGASERDISRALDGHAIGHAPADALRRRLTTITVLDPACGSGAFLVHALQRIGGLLTRLGDPRPPGAVRRAVLARSIFGVDVDPTAVWLCELRLWLAVVVEHEDGDPMSAPPLPNLDRQIRVGDSLGGELPAMAWRQPGGARIARLRERYARASGARKGALGRSLAHAERARAVARIAQACAAAYTERRELAASLRSRDLFGDRPSAPDERRHLAALRARIRTLRAEHRRLSDGGALPFAWSVHAADILDAGGFDLVVGNPPWVRLHRIPAADRAALRARYEVFARGGWARGMEISRAGRGFATQVDLAALFVERGLSLARDGGAIAYLLPAKLWRSLAGGGVRRLLMERATLELLEDWSAGLPAFDAAVYPSGLVARAGVPHDSPSARRGCAEFAEHRSGTRASWRAVPREAAVVPGDPAAPWLLLPPDARRCVDLLRERGLALADSAFGPPTLGVKTGCNEAFVVRLVERRGALAAIAAGDRSGVIDTRMLRPLLRGESLAADPSPDAAEHIVWTHDAGGAPLRRLSSHASRWLAPYESRLRARTDLRPGMAWWSLFRTASARSGTARLIWADVAPEPRVRVLPSGSDAVALNSCYVLPCASPDDAHALATLMRAPPCAAWLAALAEPARGGYLRYLAWTVALLPIPRDWPTARRVLLRLSNAAPPLAATEAVSAAYGLPPDALLPLIEWHGR